MALALAASFALVGCGGTEGNSSNDAHIAGGSEARVSGISESTGLKISLRSRIRNLKGPYPLCVLSAAKQERLSSEIHIVALPLQPGDATALLNNQYSKEARSGKRYPGISLAANRAIALALSGADYAVFESGSVIGRVPTALPSPYYIVIVEHRWLVALSVPRGFLEESHVEPLARDAVFLIEEGDSLCR